MSKSNSKPKFIDTTNNKINENSDTLLKLYSACSLIYELGKRLNENKK